MQLAAVRRCSRAQGGQYGRVDARRLGPVVGVGTWRTFDSDVLVARAVVEAAEAAGVRVYDSSPMYGGAERALGQALDGRRSDAVVATKIWTRSTEQGQEQFQRQLEWFGGRVDVEQVHNLVSWRRHLRWLERARDDGAVGRLGVTHYDASAFGELEEALRTRRFDVVQLPYNARDRESARRLLPAADELGIAVIVMEPFGAASLLRRRPARGELTALAGFGVTTWPQALLKWILSDPRVDVVIPGTANPAHLAENAAAGSPPWFGPEERAYVEQLAQ